MGEIVTVREGASCCDVWLQAVNYLAAHEPAFNLVLAIEKPFELGPLDYQIQERVTQFFAQHGADPISTVASTIFPASEYLHGGANEVFEEFPKAYQKFRKKTWGTYAGRMLTASLATPNEKSLVSPLERLVKKMKWQREHSRMRSVYEISLIEAEDLVTDIPIYSAAADSKRIRGGPCLSHLSFKLAPEDKVVLTAMYRSHYYIQRALGNLLGLAQLLAFVAQEIGADVGPLVCHSTYAMLDTEGGWSRADMLKLIAECNEIAGSAAGYCSKITTATEALEV